MQSGKYTVLLVSVLIVTSGVALAADEWPDDYGRSVGEGTHEGEIDSPDDTDKMDITDVNKGTAVYLRLDADVRDAYFAVGARRGSVSVVERINCGGSGKFVDGLESADPCYVKAFGESDSEPVELSVTETNDERTDYPWSWNATVEIGSQPDWWPDQETTTPTPTTTTTTTTTESAPSASLSVSSVQTIDAGSPFAVDSLSLDDGGFVVVHEAGPDGPVLGHSAHLTAGEYDNLQFQLEGPLPDGTINVYTVVHRDSDGDQQFDSASDEPFTNDGDVVGSISALNVQTATTTAAPTSTETTTTTEPTTSTETESGTEIKDSDGDGVIDSEDYAPDDPDVQEKEDLQNSSGGLTPGFGMTPALVGMLAAAGLAARQL